MTRQYDRPWRWRISAEYNHAWIVPTALIGSTTGRLQLFRSWAFVLNMDVRKIHICLKTKISPQTDSQNTNHYISPLSIDLTRTKIVMKIYFAWVWDRKCKQTSLMSIQYNLHLRALVLQVRWAGPTFLVGFLHDPTTTFRHHKRFWNTTWFFVLLTHISIPHVLQNWLSSI